MKKIVLKCIGCICITVFSYFLIVAEHPYLAVFTELVGLAIIFGVIVSVIEAIDDALF